MLDVDGLEILAWMVLGFDEESAIEKLNDRYDRDKEQGWDLDGALEKRFGCNFDQFNHLVERLIFMTPIAESPITGTRYHAFMNGNCAILKVEVVPF